MDGQPQKKKLEQLRGNLHDRHPDFMNRTILPVCLSLFLFFTCWRFFGVSNMLLSVPFASIFLRYEKYKPADWSFYGMIMLSETLVLLAFLADKNIILGIMINLFTIYVLVFYLTDNKASRVYFGYGYIYIISQTMGVTFSAMITRMLAVLWCALFVFLFLALSTMFSRKSVVPDYDYDIFRPFYDWKRHLMIFEEKAVRCEKSCFHMIIRPLHRNHTYFTDIRNFHYHKTRFALRMTIMTAVCFVIADLMNAPKGIWLPLNVFIMTMPYYDQSLKMIRDKIYANIGAVLLAALLLTMFTSLVQHVTLVVITTMLSYYDRSSSFYKSMYSVTTAMIVGDLSLATETLLEIRVLYVVIAAVLALIGNRFVYRNPKRRDLTY